MARARPPQEPPGSVALFARCVRGTEWVAAAELAGRLGARAVATGHREVRFRLPGALAPALDLRTVDDVFLHVASLDGIDHTRASLGVLAGAAGTLDARDAVERVRALRRTAGPLAMEVTASFLGRRNYNRFDVEDAVGRPLAEHLRVPYLSRRAGRADAPLAWRVHLADGTAVVGLRLAPRPLHRRGWKQASRVGTLHPPLAAAMALLAGLRQGGVLLDPFCGAGTVAIEAAALRPGLVAVGADISRLAVRAARGNAAAARVPLCLLAADAGGLPLAPGTVDRVASNPPWQRRVAFEGLAARDARRAWAELARVAAPAARMVLLVDDAEGHERLAREAGLAPRVLGPVSLSGRHPALVVVRPTGADDGTPFDRGGLYGAELAAAFTAQRTGGVAPGAQGRT